MKIYIFTLLFMIHLLLVGCGAENVTKEFSGGNAKSDSLNADVVNMHGSIDGIENLEQFYSNVKNKEKSNVRVVQYIIEGDPIIADYDFDGEKIDITYDTTRDAFGNGSVETFTCQKLIKDENDSNLSFIATECTEIKYPMFPLLYINYDLEMQDSFEIQLKYGTDFENEINTIDNVMVKKSETETINVSDFDLPFTAKKEVYRKLVFANYLEETNLNNSCPEKDIQYHLNVLINGTNKVFDWSPTCDKSDTGLQMTEIAKFIIQSSEETEEITEVKIQGYIMEKDSGTLLIAEDINMLDYEYIKNLSSKEVMDGYNIRLIEVETENFAKFNKGDKVLITLDNGLLYSNPAKGKAKEIIIVNPE